MNTVIKSTRVTTTGISAAATALEANAGRVRFSIQNLGTGALFVRLGDSASSTNFDFILAAGTGNDNGTAGSTGESGHGMYSGKITVYSAGTARYVASEYFE